MTNLFSPFYSRIRELKAAKKFIFPAVLLGVFMFSGCTSFATKPNPPMPPNFQAGAAGTVQWPEPAKPVSYKYETAPGSQNPLTIDDVSVKVVSISEAVGDYSIECAAPNDKSITVPLPPAAQVEITNNTDHIVALGRTAMLTGTIIKLEDNQGKEYDLFAGEMDWKAEAGKNINIYYDQFLKAAGAGDGGDAIENYKKTNASILANYKKELDATYVPKYAEYESDWKTQNRLECINPFWMLALALTGKWPPPFANFDNSISPNNLYAEAELSSSSEVEKLRQKAGSIKAKINQAILQKKSACGTKAFQMKPKRVIYSGAYPAITIVPKKTVTISVPFVKKGGDYLDEINFMIYDLPTKVDAAGIPTKRANFDIKLKRVKN